MGRPKGGRNKVYSVEEKIKAINFIKDKHLSYSETESILNIPNGNLKRWMSIYSKDGFDGLKAKKKGNPFNKLSSKSLTKEQRLELENLKLRIENERLKKGYQVKGGGVNKEYVTLNDVNMKSLKH